MSNLGLERFLQMPIGLSLARTKVGDRYVVEHMRKHDFNVGGEQSGHIVLSDFRHHRRRPGRGAAGAGLRAADGNGRFREVCRRFEPVPQVLKNVRIRAAIRRFW
jgi:phosphoglucosamine mutase